MATAALRLAGIDSPAETRPGEEHKRKRRVRTTAAKPVRGYAIFCPVRGEWRGTDTYELGKIDRSIHIYPDFRGAVAQMLEHCGHDREAVKRAVIVEVVIDPANAVCIGEDAPPALKAAPRRGVRR